MTVGFRSSKIGPRIIAMHVVSHPQAALQISAEVSPSLSFSAIWFSPSSHRVTAKSCTDLGRMELVRRKRSNAHAESCQKTSENHNEYQLVSHSKSSEVDFTPFPDCGQTMTVIPNQVRFCEAKFSSFYGN